MRAEPKTPMTARRQKSQSRRVDTSLPKQQLLLAIVASDKTFKPARRPGGFQASLVWVGKCIHCRSSLVVHPQGQADPTVTLEHIIPQALGGTDGPGNVALACARCNNQKGARLDPLGLKDARLLHVIAHLQEERRRRWRMPPAELLLSEAARAWLAFGPAPDPL